MKERPIILCTEMVRATLEGRKTKTRRVVRELKYYLPKTWDIAVPHNMYAEPYLKIPYQPEGDVIGGRYSCPYGQVGDRLWVRETGVWDDSKGFVAYKANMPDVNAKWQSPIFMPRWASRITLEITDIRVERLQEITEEDANKEGNPYPDMGGKGSLPPLWWFKKLWDSINAKRGYSWESNPWVWVISFKRI